MPGFCFDSSFPDFLRIRPGPFGPQEDCYLKTRSFFGNDINNEIKGQDGLIEMVIKGFVIRIFACFFAIGVFAQTGFSETRAQQTSSNNPTRIVTKGVSVGGGLKIDIHAPISVKSKGFLRPGKKAPVIIYVHGGGWIKGSREKIYNLDTFATERDWMLVSVQYRPVPRTNIDGQVRDVVRSINWVRQNISRYGGDRRKIVIMGHSAGSHLVSLIAARRVGGALRGVIANDVQAYDMVAYGGMRGSLPYVYAAAFGSNPKDWVRWSPVTYVRQGPRGGLPPFMIMYSGSNYERRRILANGFAGDLKAKGARVTLFNGRRYTHGSIARGIGPSPEVTRAVERFLRRAFR